MAFVGLVGLYACSVRRLRTEKRIAAIFVGFAPAMFVGCFALAVAFRGLSCCCFAPVVCADCVFFVGLCCWWFFFPSDGFRYEKGAHFLRPFLRWLLVGC